jgi:hypothetical protein
MPMWWMKLLLVADSAVMSDPRKAQEVGGYGDPISVFAAPLSLESTEATAGVDGFAGQLPLVEVLEVRVLGSDDSERTILLDELRGVDVSRVGPVRMPTPHFGQTNLHTIYFFVKLGRHLFAESVLEHRWLRWWDFSSDVVAVATQPMNISYVDSDGEGHSHTPDALVELFDGSIHIVNIKPPSKPFDERLPADLAVCDWVAQRCGWSTSLVFDLDPIVDRNLRWLRNFARPVWDPDDIASELILCVGNGCRTDALLREIVHPQARPLLFSLIWAGELEVDLTLIIDGPSLVWRGRESDG